MSLISPDDYRAVNPETPLTDEALQLRIDAIEAEITAKYGDVSALVQTVTGGERYLFPARPVASVTSITERVGDVTTTLAADDYEIQDGGRSLLRIGSGTTPRSRWGTTLVLTAVTADSTAIRKGVIIDLLDLDLRPQGLASKDIGEWSESYVTGSQNATRETTRNEIMGRLSGGPTIW